MGRRVNLEGVAGAGQPDQIDLERSPVAGDDTLDEGLETGALFRRNQGAKWSSEKLIQSVCSEGGEAGLVHREELGVFGETDENDGLCFEDGAQMRLSLGRLFDTNRLVARRSRHGCHIGSKLPWDY
jgi:hypothetical protein